MLNESLDYEEIDNDNNNDQKKMKIKDKQEQDSKIMASQMLLRPRVLNKQPNKTQKKYQTDKDYLSETSKSSSESSSASNESEKYNTRIINDSAYCGSNSNLNMVISRDDVFNRLPDGTVVGRGACGVV